MISIKTATKNDYEILSLLGRVTFNESHGNYINDKSDLLAYLETTFSIEKTKENLQNENNMYFIIYVDDFPVGYAKIILNSQNDIISVKEACCLDKLYVLNDFIAMKLGYQLLNVVLEETKKLGVKYLWLYVYEKNDRAINFYLKNNFISKGTHTFYIHKTGYPNNILLKKI